MRKFAACPSTSMGGMIGNVLTRGSKSRYHRCSGPAPCRWQLAHFGFIVSSTFEDLEAERDALQREVFPKLRGLCEQNGARFQAIDLRGGVRDGAAPADHARGQTESAE